MEAQLSVEDGGGKSRGLSQIQTRAKTTGMNE